MFFFIISYFKKIQKICKLYIKTLKKVLVYKKNLFCLYKIATTIILLQKNIYKMDRKKQKILLNIHMYIVRVLL